MRVALADDSALFRSGLARLLEAIDVDVVAEVADVPELLAAVETHQPDAVVADIRMPPSFTDEGLVAADELRRAHPRLAVLVLSTHVEAGAAMRLLSSGVGRFGYLLKDRVADIGALRNALERLVDGQVVVDPLVVAELLHHRLPRSPLDELSRREIDVLKEMAKGRSNAAIAEELHLSERTVENHTARVFSKLGISAVPDVNRRVQAVLLWLRHAAAVPKGGPTEGEDA